MLFSKYNAIQKPAANATWPMYNNPLIIPLADWIETPIAQDLIHEASTLQVLGLTNYSHWKDHIALRHCFFTDSTTRTVLEKIAEARLMSMAHVGLTERLDESVLSLAADLGVKMNDTAWKSVARTAFTYDEPSFNYSAVVSYNTSNAETGVVTGVRVTVEEARRKLSKVKDRKKVVDDKIKKMLPKLEGLVAKEDAYLEAAALAEQKWYGKARKAWTQGLRVSLSWLPLSMQKGALFLAGGVPLHLDANGTKEVESPWAQEIEELDDVVYDLQQESKVLKVEVESLERIPRIRGPKTPRGPGRLIFPDNHHLETRNVGNVYAQCAQNATTKGKKRRVEAFVDLRTPWDDGIDLSSEQRKAIDPAIIARIEELNPSDQRLWQLGYEILEARLKKQKELGLLEDFPVVTPNVVVKQVENPNSDPKEENGGEERKEEEEREKDGAGAEEEEDEHEEL